MVSHHGNHQTSSDCNWLGSGLESFPKLGCPLTLNCPSPQYPMTAVYQAFPVALGHGNEVMSFDLGGTSFRSALLTGEGSLAHARKIASLNCRSLPGRSPDEIVSEIASYIAETVCALCPPKRGKHSSIAISMGAALNAHTGKILGSGPILGEGSPSLDLDTAIRHGVADSQVTIVNDVTASLIAHSRIASLRHARRLALITVSTGIASRVLTCSIPHIPVCPILGTQGEIGHHPIAFSLDGVPLSLKCSCGGQDHLNAFASGQGIREVLAQVRVMFPQEFRRSFLSGADTNSEDRLAVFQQALANDDPLSRRILKAVTLPVAEAIKWHFMLDPEIDKLILTGGVCFLLGEVYLASILENLAALEFYPMGSAAEAFWAEHIMLGPVSDDAGLIGAAYMARELPNFHRRETLSLNPPYRVSRQNATDYSVHLGDGIFEKESFPQGLLEPFERIILVADATVDELYGNEIRQVLAGSKRRVETVVLQASEQQKDMETLESLVSSFEDLGVRRRRDLIAAAGGGIILDLVSLAANLFRRGIPCLRIPTTLVAAIDAGIGLKNAVNFRQCKSRLGTYAPPYAVVVDPRFLATLPDRQIRNGLSEALKISLVADPVLFELIEDDALRLVMTKLRCPAGDELTRRSIRAMLLELSPNLYERSLERSPDYGHTFSPVLEFALDDLQHGEAVALDMAIATALAVLLGVLDMETADRILDVQRALGLPIVHDEITVQMLVHGVEDAKKHRGGQLRMPILQGIGQVMFLDDVSHLQLLEALSFVRSWADESAVEARQSA
jgi:3-dehydroquinate synthetase/predicted NBD/HSP70 family sugar kinase